MSALTLFRSAGVRVCVRVIKLNTELPSVGQKHSLATFTAPVATSIRSDEFFPFPLLFFVFVFISVSHPASETFYVCFLYIPRFFRGVK